MNAEALVGALASMATLLEEMGAKQVAQSQVISAVMARTFVSRSDLSEFAESMTDKFDAAISASEGGSSSGTVHASVRGEIDEIFARALRMRRK